MKITALVLTVLVLNLSGCERESGLAGGSPPKGDTTISREIATPSGDWAGRIDYTYGVDGMLRRASYVFTTFNGYDTTTEDFATTKCVREYNASADGTLVLDSKITTDLSSGERVERTFYEPEISHWITLAEARKELQAEGDGDLSRSRLGAGPASDDCADYNRRKERRGKSHRR